MRDLLQPMHLLIIALVFVLLFGGKKFAELGKGLGQGIRDFKKNVSASKEAADEVNKK